MRTVLEERMILANLPTPIQKLERLTEYLDGPQIYIKRDDLTGIGFSGNKIRKLEYCTYHAIKQGCNLLITCGGIQSNHARATAAVAAKLGMKCHLILNGEEPQLSEGNHFLDLMFGAEITWVQNCDLKDLEKEILRIAEERKEKGDKPYLVPLGASDSTGSLGYVNASYEMKGQFEMSGFMPDHIICPTGSAGTMAGLSAGKAFYDLPARITGISVAFESSFLHSKITEVFRDIGSTYLPEIRSMDPDFDIVDGYIGEGYTKTDREQLAFIKKAASLEGILLDPTYTGKAMYGLAGEISNGRFSKDETVLFLHTGGVFGLFPYRQMLQTEQGLIG